MNNIPTLFGNIQHINGKINSLTSRIIEIENQFLRSKSNNKYPLIHDFELHCNKTDYNIQKIEKQIHEKDNKYDSILSLLENRLTQIESSLNIIQQRVNQLIVNDQILHVNNNIEETQEKMVLNGNKENQIINEENKDEMDITFKYSSTEETSQNNDNAQKAPKKSGRKKKDVL